MGMENRRKKHKPWYATTIRNPRTLTPKTEGVKKLQKSKNTQEDEGKVRDSSSR